MTSADRKKDYEEVLAKHGWRSTNVIAAHGLMASSRATLGEVESLSEARVGFAKCIWQATGTAGHETHMLAGHERLARLAERLRLLSGLTELPIVRMFGVHLESAPACLLIVMDRVVPMQAVMLRGRNDALAAQLLRAFDPYANSTKWLHFDICPANSGLDSDGAPVLIDPESAYALASGGALDNTCLAAKWFRSPGQWMDDISALGSVGRSFDDIAVHKHAYESLLLAAELSLGQHAQVGHTNRVEEWLLPWLAEIEKDESLRPRVSFWRRALVAAFDRATTLNLSEIALELENLGPPAVRTPSVIPAALPPISTDDLRAYAHRMRLDRLTEADLRHYLQALVTKARTDNNVEDWTEACLLCLCYLRDRDEARRLLDEATTRHSTNEELGRWRRMLELWLGEAA